MKCIILFNLGESGGANSNSSSKLSDHQSSNSDFDNLELNDELAAENVRLKQTIADLRLQLSNAEVSLLF